MSKTSNALPDLEWNVVWHSFNKKQIEKFNVFRHRGFFESVVKLTKEKDYDTFQNKLRREAMYYFWSKFEYEILITDMMGDGETKIDIYYQLELNWDKFSRYVWNSLHKRSDDLQNK